MVGHIGRFCYQKNHEFLIDVFEEIHRQRPEAVLMLIGRGEMESVIRRKVNRRGLQDAVLFFGQPQKDRALLSGDGCVRSAVPL